MYELCLCLLMLSLESFCRGENQGKSSVTINIKLDQSVHFVDNMFLANSMPHKIEKWNTIPF
ncbi:hypothetical protein BgiMline_028712, partial [Biomphalaria glabrata]